MHDYIFLLITCKYYMEPLNCNLLTINHSIGYLYYLKKKCLAYQYKISINL